MAHVTLPLKEMTVREKLEGIERVWESQRGQEEKFESPAWHGELLAARKKMHAEGMARFSAWPEAF